MAELPIDMIFHYHSDDGITIKVDAIPLVRCKDCVCYQAYSEFGVNKGYGFCAAQGMSPKVDEWFCADGERKEQSDGYRDI